MKVKSVDGTREFEWAKNIVEGNKNQRVSNEMGATMYFVICCNEDGDVSVDKYEKGALLKALNGNYYGNIEFFDKMPEDNDPQYWYNKALIINGDIVTPKPVDVVREYEI